MTPAHAGNLAVVAESDSIVRVRTAPTGVESPSGGPFEERPFGESTGPL